jgi:hypothetical protein
MRKRPVAPTLAGVILATSVSSPHPAHAMIVGAQLSILSATALTQVQRAGWCGRRGCLGRPYYQSPPPLRILLLSALALLQLLFWIGLVELWGVSVTSRGRRDAWD